MKVTKFSGEQVDYQPEKLIRSLKKSGAEDDGPIAKVLADTLRAVGN